MSAMTDSPSPSRTSGTAGDHTGMLFGQPIPMSRALALIDEAIGDDQARVRMPFNPDHTNSRGEVHGGALLALFDCTLACAARSHDPAGMVVITVDLTTHFVTAARGDVIATARCLRRDRSIAFSQGEARDDAGVLLATATATLKLVPRNKPAGTAPPKQPT